MHLFTAEPDCEFLGQGRIGLLPGFEAKLPGVIFLFQLSLMFLEVRIGLRSYPEGLVEWNAKTFLGFASFFIAQRRTMDTARTLLCRSSLANNAIQDYERRPVFFGLGFGG